MSKEDIGIKFASDPFVLGELLAVVGGQRMNAGRERRQQGNCCIRDGLGGFERNVGDQGTAGLALIERHQRRTLAGADDQMPSQSPKRFRLSTMA